MSEGRRWRRSRKRKDVYTAKQTVHNVKRANQRNSAYTTKVISTNSANDNGSARKLSPRPRRASSNSTKYIKGMNSIFLFFLFFYVFLFFLFFFLCASGSKGPHRGSSLRRSRKPEQTGSDNQKRAKRCMKLFFFGSERDLGGRWRAVPSVRRKCKKTAQRSCSTDNK